MQDEANAPGRNVNNSAQAMSSFTEHANVTNGFPLARVTGCFAAVGRRGSGMVLGGNSTSVRNR
jgi:hypothetical protein